MIVQSGARSARRSRFLGTAFPPFSKPLLRVVTAASLAGFAMPALAGSPSVLPTGGAVASGAATIGAPANNSLTVTQTSSKAIINWQSFSVGQPNTVTINNGTGATLNRVTGSQSSNISGNLNATGSVYATGSVGISTTHTAGGLVGYNNGGTILDAYAAAPVQGAAAVGALIGSNSGSTTNTYYDTDVTGSLPGWAGNTNFTTHTPVPLGGTHPSAIVQSSYVGFDFTNHWTITPSNTPTLIKAP